MRDYPEKQQGPGHMTRFHFHKQAVTI